MARSMVIFAVLGLALAGCKITEPGSRGVFTFALMQDASVLHQSDPAVEVMLRCGEVQAFTVVADEPTALCEGYDSWDMLFREAQRQGDAKIAQVSCPQAAGFCPLRNPWIVRQRADCEGEKGPFFEIQYQVKCIGDGEVPVPGLPFADPDRINVPLDDVDGPLPLQPPATEVITSSLFRFENSQICPSTFNFTVGLEEVVASCRIADYRVYLDKVATDASTLAAAASCMSPCAKQGLVETYAAWDCKTDANGTSRVEIDSRWSVDCR